MRKYTIGVLIGNANSDHVRNIMNGITNVAEKIDVNIIFYLSYHMAYYYNIFSGEKTSADDFDNQASVVYDYAGIGDVDALIFTFGSLTIFLKDTNLNNFVGKFEGIPYVIIEDTDESNRGSSVMCDNYGGMVKVVEHLVSDHGYTRLTCLAGPSGNREARERKRAFEDVLRAHDIDITDDMFEEGDYSENVEQQINRLIESHPDMQAMVCANDLMAKTAYQVFEAKGYEVGTDVAVTGFDDEEIAATLVPPLTTVFQNEYDIAYEALNQAISLIEGGEPKEIVVNAVECLRYSCGCHKIKHENYDSWYSKLEKLDDEAKVEEAVRSIADRIIETKADDYTRNVITGYIRDCVSEQYDLYHDIPFEDYDSSHFARTVELLVSGSYSKVISVVSIEKAIENYIKSVMQRETNKEKLVKLSDILALDMRIVYRAQAKHGFERYEDYEQNTMYLPLISRDMMNHMGVDEDFYKTPLRILSHYDVKSAYLVTTEKPIQNRNNKQWKLPKKLYLASYFDGENIVGYKQSERPVITVGEGVLRDKLNDGCHTFSAFGLFLGDKQYGLLIAEINNKNQMLINQAAMQISIAMEFRSAYEKQTQMKDKLALLVDEVREKNKILSFLSENDQLTGIMNRRGFVERFMQIQHEHEGEYGITLLADLDHLKQINDGFGHSEGDYALQHAAEILQEALGDNAVVARFGGDEFAAVISSDKRISGKVLISRIKEVASKYNDISDKPYYIDLSVGYCTFVCNPSEDLDTLLKKSDVMLYEIKRDRRTDVRKNIAD